MRKTIVGPKYEITERKRNNQKKKKTTTEAHRCVCSRASGDGGGDGVCAERTNESLNRMPDIDYQKANIFFRFFLPFIFFEKKLLYENINNTPNETCVF